MISKVDRLRCDLLCGTCNYSPRNGQFLEKGLFLIFLICISPGAQPVIYSSSVYLLTYILGLVIFDPCKQIKMPMGRVRNGKL